MKIKFSKNIIYELTFHLLLCAAGHDFNRVEHSPNLQTKRVILFSVRENVIVIHTFPVDGRGVTELEDVKKDISWTRVLSFLGIKGGGGMKKRIWTSANQCICVYSIHYKRQTGRVNGNLLSVGITGSRWTIFVGVRYFRFRNISSIRTVNCAIVLFFVFFVCFFKAHNFGKATFWNNYSQ